MTESDACKSETSMSSGEQFRRRCCSLRANMRVSHICPRDSLTRPFKLFMERITKHAHPSRTNLAVAEAIGRRRLEASSCNTQDPRADDGAAHRCLSYRGKRTQSGWLQRSRRARFILSGRICFAPVPPPGCIGRPPICLNMFRLFVAGDARHGPSNVRLRGGGGPLLRK